ncbi:hypothetical protein [Mesomycoplasma ovipneumoniae]|uniref:hypothetical protein n=1 Tax=Mesomycoplasma ovipneumoniae TaxID=29562 RepID=UPI002964D62E|nr:hypothetical protein [Mesomycoplasma ovipneumoniae]MDW2909370.1 hypothetical protein [Mesomycoplasma ovipneumoniae]
MSNNAYKNLLENVFDKSKIFLNQNQGQNWFFESLVKKLAYNSVKTSNTENAVDSKVSTFSDLYPNKNFNLDKKDKKLKTGRFTKIKTKFLLVKV